jgi:hypothetical protein
MPMSEPTQIEVSIPHATVLAWVLSVFPSLKKPIGGGYYVRLVEVTDSYRGSIRFMVERAKYEKDQIEETPE